MSRILLFQDRVVVPSEAQVEVVRRVHAAGHFGQKRTLQNLRRSYFWLGMSRDARKVCQSCFTCQRAKRSNRARVPIQDFRVEGLGPGDLVAMDVGTLPWADDKFRYFLCIVDVFTRYIELAPLQDQTAASLIREFERGWIFRGHGVPRGLLSDQAHNIDGVEVRKMCDRLGIEKRHSIPYHPQADGLVERSIGLVKQVARCLTLDRQLPKESWPDILPEVAFYCNNAENSSTKFSAQLLMTGRQPLSPIDAMLTRKDGTSELSYSQHAERLKQLSSELKSLAAENDRQSRMDRNYSRNQGAQLPPFAKGDLVLEANERCRDSLDPKYGGPYVVADVRGANVKIKKGRKLKWIHVSRCKLFKEGCQIPVTTRVVEQAANTEGPEEKDVTGGEELHDASLEPIEQELLMDTAEIENPHQVEQEPDEQLAEPSTQRRYPLRNRKTKKYDDYVLGMHHETDLDLFYRRSDVTLTLY